MAEEIDHVIPVCSGGTDDSDNLVAACHRCNWDKWTSSVEEWRDFRIAHGEAWPPLPSPQEDYKFYVRNLFEKSYAEALQASKRCGDELSDSELFDCREQAKRLLEHQKGMTIWD